MSNENELTLRCSCFQVGYVFGPGTRVKRNYDGQELLLAGIMSDWRNEGSILYMAFSPLEEKEIVQDWISEAELMGGKEYTILHEVLASNINEQREAAGG